MCGRFVCELSPDTIRARFGTTNPLLNHPPSWNVAPTQSTWVIRRNPETKLRHLDVLHWGLVPHFTKDLKTARKPINARSETAHSSGMFRQALEKRRCIVPASAFYEWRTMPDGKQPYAVARRDGEPLALAGLWESWRAPDDSILRSFTILTTDANTMMRRLHHRMPVILNEPDWAVWMGETEGDAAQLMRPSSEDLLRIWPVSRAVNNVRNNSADLLDVIDDPQALPSAFLPTG